MELEAVLAEALKLPATSRAELAARLLGSIDGEGAVEKGHARAWSDEIAERVHDVREGRVKLVDAKQVFKRAKARIKSQRR